MSSTPPPDQKDVEYYAAQANAWFNTALEHDKSILALSSGAIGLLVTILTTVGAKSQLDQWLFGLALLSFVVSAVTILVIFRKNKAYLEDLVKNKESRLESELRKYDLLAICAFGLGISLVVALGISSVVQPHQRKIIMSKKITLEEALRTARDEPTFESYVGANKMRAQPEEIKSFGGAGRVAPATNAPAATQPAASAQETTSPPATSTPTPKK
ncbi:hypothetical protein [Xanthomonas nasturtii]|uniref:Transmembrane protein n=1 Tax=Xanthomonas nasturtii TaxID=1843581 RepID=A0ABT0LWP3_9XANT|nr:hypothetical protein [Xanthomonas nasturtii]MCL1553760.1 hypothetical protein [Xanthomonas nasturtii]MCL1557836.1 hypothetical protein [Xanthomonas nasturtii]MCL1561745.1 hypothetical protein [Xanthomonas nasturtii]